MKIAHIVIGAAGSLAFCLGTFIAEYVLTLSLGILVVLFAGASGLSIVIASLLQAPEGYEDRDGFHIQRRQISGRRRNRSFSRAMRGLRVDLSHLLSNS